MIKCKLLNVCGQSDTVYAILLRFLWTSQLNQGSKSFCFLFQPQTKAVIVSLHCFYNAEINIKGSNLIKQFGWPVQCLSWCLILWTIWCIFQRAASRRRRAWRVRTAVQFPANSSHMCSVELVLEGLALVFPRLAEGNSTRLWIDSARLCGEYCCDFRGLCVSLWTTAPVCSWFPVLPLTW